jgi:hypothetical protein
MEKQILENENKNSLLGHDPTNCGGCVALRTRPTRSEYRRANSISSPYHATLLHTYGEARDWPAHLTDGFYVWLFYVINFVVFLWFFVGLLFFLFFRIGLFVQI